MLDEAEGGEAVWMKQGEVDEVGVGEVLFSIRKEDRGRRSRRCRKVSLYHDSLLCDGSVLGVCVRWLCFWLW